MIRTLSVVTLLAAGATIAYAQNLDAIKQRREVMKVIATAGIEPTKMSKDEAPFDLAKVRAMLKAYQDEAPKLKKLFPDDFKTGGDTDAAPKIWQARAEFDAAINSLVTLSKAAASAVTDEATFKAEFPKVARGCNGCHKREDGFAPRLSDSFKKLKQ